MYYVSKHAFGFGSDMGQPLFVGVGKNKRKYVLPLPLPQGGVSMPYQLLEEFTGGL
jgi:hypothetical protein